MPIHDVEFGSGVEIPHPDLVNLYGCKVGNGCFVGPFVEIQRGVVIGDGSRIQSHTFICSGVTVGRDVFVAHGVMFVNDRYPVHDEAIESVLVEDLVVLGSNVTIVSPCRIGRGAVVGAGAVVVNDVPPGKLVFGNPARVIGDASGPRWGDRMRRQHAARSQQPT